MGKTKPAQHAQYEQMQDTPYITQARDLSNRGYQGYIGNYENVNVFSPEVQNQMAARNQAIYNRAEGDFDRQYRDTMQRLANKNYSQFGTTSATPALYRTDMANLQQQRKLADLAYDKALNYENVVNNELKRRYDTLNMYKTMYDYGKIPYQLDLQNWGIRNLNKDVDYMNDQAMAAYRNAQANSWLNAGQGALSGALTGFATGGLGGALAGGVLGGGAGYLGMGTDTASNLANAGVSGYNQYFGTSESPTLSPWASSFNQNFGR